MATAEFWQRGEALDYTNAGDTVIEAGTIVVIGDKIGVTGCPIEPGEVGSLHVVGVFEMPLTDAAGVEMGTTVYWDGNGITATSGESTVEAGYAAADAAAGAETILVKLCG